jgi:hypothetical protein
MRCDGNALQQSHHESNMRAAFTDAILTIEGFYA